MIVLGLLLLLNVPGIFGTAIWSKPELDDPVCTVSDNLDKDPLFSFDIIIKSQNLYLGGKCCNL